MAPCPCPFCSPDADLVIPENDRALALQDRHPVSEGPTLELYWTHALENLGALCPGVAQTGFDQ